MKKIFLGLMCLAFVAVFAPKVFAAKPADNHTGAQKYGWHLSGDVMPVPPYGTADIEGSDTASKLIFNQPNGNVIANLTGVMNGLHPSTPYTVYLSNIYTPCVFTGWNVAKVWNVDIAISGGAHYSEILTLNQDSSGIITGTLALPGPTSIWDITNGYLEDDNQLVLEGHYRANSIMTIRFTATIAKDGRIVDGYWKDTEGSSLHREGTWASTSGHATKNYSGGTTSWPGYLTDVVAFTFTTDSSGSGSWHLNLRNSDSSLPDDFSVWINESGKTILVSDPIEWN